MKDCPFCKGSIPEDAAKCLHCGEWVNRPAEPPRSGDGMKALGEAAKTGVAVYAGLSILGLVIGIVFFLAFFLPSWNRAEKRHEEFQKKFDQDWEKARQRNAEFDKKFNADWNR